MEEKKDICSAIISDAEAYAAETVKAAEEYAGSKLKEAEFEVQTFAVRRTNLPERKSRISRRKTPPRKEWKRKKSFLRQKWNF